MQRELKFRAWDNERKMFVPQGEVTFSDYGDTHISVTPNCIEYIGDSCHNGEPQRSRFEILQYTGLKDKNGKEIYEGDIVRWRVPYRTTQTHEGDNIPNGSYTEPMEPAIKTYEREVIFKDGCFCFDVDNEFSISSPMIWNDTLWDEQQIKTAIEYRKLNADFWDDPDEGDKDYLIKEYGLKDLDGLIKFLSGLEITGNIYENPELIKP